MTGSLKTILGQGPYITDSSTSVLTNKTLQNAKVSVSSSLTAAGSTQGTATAIPSDINVVTTVAVNSGVILGSTVGSTQIIINKGANALNVYPASGAAIDALSTNTAISIPINGWIEFNIISSTQVLSTYNASISASALVGLSSTTTNYTAQQYFGTQVLTDGATINWSVNTAQVAKVTLGGNRTMAAPTGLVDGAFYSINVIQDATGNRTLSWNSVFKFTGGSAPILSTAANAKDFFTFKSDGTNLYEQGRSLNVA